MRYQIIDHYIPINKCSDIQKQSLANLIAFPDQISPELHHYIYNQPEDIICEILFTSSDHIIGGYIAKIIPAYQVICIKELAINPKLKSSRYGRLLIDRMGQKGLKIYGSNFRGIVATSFCTKKEKNKDIYQSKALFNAGGKLVVECAKVKNKFLHFIYIPFNGGYKSDEVKEIFSTIFKI